MQLFKVVAAKNNERVELVVRHETEAEARENLHGQGYSIIEIHETTEVSPENGNTFYFDILLSWTKKSGKIVSDDIFHAYRKLVDDLKYDVIAIYDNKEASEEEKSYTTSKVRESFSLYKGEKKKEKIEETVEHSPIQDAGSTSVQSGVFAKELQYYQGVIGKVIDKIESLLVANSETLSSERKKRLELVMQQLRQVRQLTNIDKLKQIWEVALLKIGELEMELIEHRTDLKRSEYLKETNKLLKTLGSSQKIGFESDKIGTKLQTFFSFLGEIFKSETKEKKESLAPSLSKGFTYYKNLRDLAVYKEKLREVNLEILKNLFSKKEKKDRLLLKKRLILQNILLIEKRITQKRFSYTQIVKGISYYKDIFLMIVRSSSDVAMYSVAFVSFLFLLSEIGVFFSLSAPYSPSSFFIAEAVIYVLLFQGVYSSASFLASVLLFSWITTALVINF